MKKPYIDKQHANKLISNAIRLSNQDDHAHYSKILWTSLPDHVSEYYYGTEYDFFYETDIDVIDDIMLNIFVKKD